jgi:hypothetical protein
MPILAGAGVLALVGAAMIALPSILANQPGPTIIQIEITRKGSR